MVKSNDSEDNITKGIPVHSWIYKAFSMILFQPDGIVISTHLGSFLNLQHWNMNELEYI